MTFLKTIALSLALPLMATAAAGASVFNLIGNQTTVSVTADLAGLGLTPGTTGTATANGADFSFGITGGSVDLGTGEALIEHDGSGVSLTDGTSTATVGNFFIDTAAGTISGTLNDAIDDVVFFTLGNSTADGIQVLISSALGGALTDVFGAPNLTGAQFGLANVDLQVAPIPLPAGLPLLVAGIAAFGLIRRKQNA
ncbi:MAG: VPLPA-CTERM sorting domain-containing protein [Pseudomonadota bacterium]